MNVHGKTNDDVPTSKKNFVAVVTAPSSSAMMAHLPSQGYQSPHKLPPTISIESRVNKLDPTSAEPRLSRPPGHHSHPLTGYMGRKLDKVKKEISVQVFVSRISDFPPDCMNKTRTAEPSLTLLKTLPALPCPPPVRRESSSALGVPARSKESSVLLNLCKPH